MAGRNPSQRRPETLDVLDEFSSLDDYFKEMNRKQFEMNKIREKANKDLVKKQTEEMKKAIKDWTKEELQLSKLGVKDLNQYKKKFLKDFQKEQQKQEIETLKKVYSKILPKEELIKSKQENKEIYETLKAFKEAGNTLTKAQQKQMEQAKKDYIAGRLAEIEKKLLGKLSDLTNAINSGINTYSNYQAGINARLQGSRNLSDIQKFRYGRDNIFGAIEERLTAYVGNTPYMEFEDLMNNLQSLVQVGIASDVEQRAFLQTVKDDVATTFDAANSSLLRIVKLQQQDSTAARLGMEAYLTRFLNELVSNTEYLNQTFDNVESALLEASSQMSTEVSTEFEYIVQKWLGALTGVGLSETSATSIAQAIGQLGSGNIEDFGSGGIQNLMTLAATRAGLSLGDILNTGLNAQTVNMLMESMVRYMSDMSTKQSNVVKSQFAKTFGLSVSDIKAASQLLPSIDAVSKNMMSYIGMYDELGSQLSSLSGRMSQSEMIENLFSNMQFSLASDIARNPIKAATWKVTDLIQSVTGGINIPATFAAGFGFDMNTTVENLMKLGLVGTSTLGMIGDIASGLGSTFHPETMLTKLDIVPGGGVTKRGTGISTRDSGMSTSLMTYAGNTSGGDVYEQTLGPIEHRMKQEVSAKKDEFTQEDKTLEYLNTKLDSHLVNLIGKVEEINQKLNGQIKVDISDSDIAGITTGITSGLTMF